MGCAAQLLDERGIHFGDDGRQPRRPPAEHQPDAGDETLRAVVGVRHDQLVAGGVCARFHRLVDVEEERVLDVRDDHADGAAAPPGQALRVQVRAVFQLLHHFQHARPRRALHRRAVVQHAGHGGGRHTRPAGDLFERHRGILSRRPDSGASDLRSASALH